MKYNSETIGKIIKLEREKLKLTQEQLGKCIFKVGKQISVYEKGGTIPPIDSLLDLCEVFDCELGYLLGEPSYSQKTKKDTLAHEVTGLDLEALRILKVITGEKSSSLEFGRHSQEYRELLNALIKAKGFTKMIEGLFELNQLQSDYRSVWINLQKKYEDSHFIDAIERYNSTSSYQPIEDEGISEAIVDIDQSIDKERSLEYSIKVIRFELFEIFQALVDEVIPINAPLNE